MKRLNHHHLLIGLGLNLPNMGVLLPGCSALAQPVPDLVWSTNGHAETARSLAFSGGGMMLASGADDARIKIWSLNSQTLVRTIVVDQANISSVAFSPDQTLVAAGDDYGKARVWRVSDGAQVWIRGGGDDNYVDSVSFSPDGNLVGAGRSGTTGGVEIWNTLTGNGLPLDESEIGAIAVCFSPDGTLLASGNRDHSASLWRLAGGAPVRNLVGHSHWVMSMDFSPDGTLLATASLDGTTRFWRVADGTQVRVLEGGGGHESNRFSLDGRLLLGSFGGHIRFWRVSDGQLLLTYSNLNAGPIAVSGDGKYFAYGENPPPPAAYTGAFFVARMPLWISDAGRTNEDLRLNWQGGSGLYQLQQTSNVASPVWQNVGDATTNTSTNLPLPATNAFFRVQDLTNAP